MKQKKLGLALGSGAARGFAHLGVLQALEEKGIRIDYISGCSIGALIGARCTAAGCRCWRLLTWQWILNPGSG